jgi:DNA replication initiation complex subunit (GINS family)
MHAQGGKCPISPQTISYSDYLLPNHKLYKKICIFNHYFKNDLMGVNMDQDINISYDLLFDILRYEKSREELQHLDKNFFKNVVEYLQTKDGILINVHTPTSERELTRIQLNNVRKLLSELYERRERKIISLALYKLKTGSEVINRDILQDEEKMLFDSVFLVFNKYRQSILDNIINNKLPFAQAMVFDDNITQNDSKKQPIVEQEDENSVKSIRFIKPVPKFLGSELEIYGPYDEHEIASLPSRIANILIRKQRAEHIKAG